MKTILVLLLILTVGVAIGTVFVWSDPPFEVAKMFFEHSRKQEVERAKQLWSLDPGLSDPNLPQDREGSSVRFRRDIFFAKQIAEGGDQIIDHREFSKDKSSTVLCLSVRNEKGLKRVLRVVMIKTNFGWRISDMMNANEDVLAVLNEDCGTVEF